MRRERLLLVLFFVFVLPINYSFSQIPDPYDVFYNFVPSGYMGDNKNIIVAQNVNDSTRPDFLCTKISYEAGDSGFGGVYWQYPANNWCIRAGRDLSTSGFTKLTFWVKGQKGGEVVKFRVGQDCGDSFVSDELTKLLSVDWIKVTILVKGTSLTNITGAFCWVVDSKANPNINPVVFYLDDTYFE